MNDFLVDAMRAVQRRFEGLVSLYPNVHGNDAQLVYSDSLTLTHALAAALAALALEISNLVKRHHDLIQQSLQESQKLLSAYQQQSSASPVLDCETAALHSSAEQLSLAVARTSFNTSVLTYNVTGQILAIVNISCVGVLANVEASDRHYENEAITRFRELVTGLLVESIPFSELFSSIKECLSAMRNVLLARLRDAKQADEVFIRERSYQELTNYSGFAIEMLRLIVHHLNTAWLNRSEQPVSFSIAVDEWRTRIEAANKMLGRNGAP